jgi:quercetin dioxygenase-like cupin family protein
MPTQQTINKGAHKAGPGRTFFDMPNLSGLAAGPGYAETFGPVVEGEHIQCGVMSLPGGSVAAAHTHPNEQWIYVLEGSITTTIDGESHDAGPGQLVYIPPNAVHGTVVHSKEGCRFFTCKDLAGGGIAGALTRRLAITAP